MNFASSYHVVTGAGRGIGRAIAVGLAQRGAAGVALIDVVPPLRAAAAAEAAAESQSFRALPIAADVSTRDGVHAAIATARAAFGRIDGMVCNAGVASGLEAGTAFSAVGESAESWERSMSINCLAHVWAAESVVPEFESREEGGSFVTVASAAGLLTQVGAPSYSVSKAAAVAFAASLAVHHGDRGVRVHCVCPQAVATSLVGLPSEDPRAAPPPGALAGGADEGVLSPAAVAEATLDAMASGGELLVLPHPEVAGYAQMRASAPTKWVRGMRKLRDAIAAGKTPLVQA
ncbi:hypothetical protein EMIHUDRAFT_446855 [Emiliania huxleyi CCMP1516]|uniref:Uncharacterized protein n=2 Tax=Emiliania huxleyi TaxID=2903 RepID=A0A0D3K9G9_EMIH1|nr:hypothetical protein EMIHUDRAFT_441988 [Emiliania huxleyi CCMP1516]XP_005791537.1 hypothetical protein EMIHUDRAFT_446855 [Emiliania huxleyi CCMP1516]EOD32404.1 hypothetical protein EMIHUDRAFT_441988 [Emiliania huxleyi CCMP1516]EOD39108.1 hypothetical protein EMIHUDRAFT_446855 [Emiliania huxleyi CCMP1516]|mmetsp:Transcript_25307/g.81606  ORF Transcript_25307/g.81606 Transcript_25307/m.81606 type:complete len:290 (+) Transcript_25307:124-993(+)|eukprot:XP_005784833.1 hypothetical protein EMIHUDRAFT_441988 [Emiliania huxleyi CCMP1516]